MSGLTTNLLKCSSALRMAASRMSSDAPQRFGTAKGHSGWTYVTITLFVVCYIMLIDHLSWDNNGIGMGGKDAGPGTEIKEGLGKGKDYPNPEFFKYNNYSYFDIEKQVVDSNKRVEQPKSGLTEFW